MNKSRNSIGIALVCTSFLSTAGAYAPDGRSNGMGNIGVATADYLAAPLYNPALAAVFDESDDVGFLLPAVGLNAKDADSSIGTLKNLQDAIDDLENNGRSAGSKNEIEQEINDYLDELDGSEPIHITAGVAFAIAIPSKVVAANLFARGYVESISKINVAANHGDVEQRYDNTDVTVTGFGYSELGIALARPFEIYGETFTFGVTPKYQMLKTFTETTLVNDFAFELDDDDSTSKNTVNFDMGAVWLKNNFRAALAVHNMLEQEIVSTQGHTYELTPQATLGLAYASEYFTMGVDVDLTEQTRFVHLEDNTQFVRVGMELNVWNWAQLRAGYEYDMQGSMENAITAGLGISPFGALNLDVAGSYASNNQVGVSTNLSFTF